MNRVRCTYTLHPATRNELKNLSTATRISASSLVEEALQDLFKKHRTFNPLLQERKEDSV